MAKTKLDKIIVMDLEATCWENHNIPPGQMNEIIEIGACFIDLQTLKIEKPMSFKIRPTTSYISDFCTQLTGHTWEDLKNAPPLLGALNTFTKEFGTKSRVWASWGDSDRTFTEKQCKHYGVQYPFGEKHINISNQFAIARGIKREVGLAKALDLLNIPFEGRQHSGVDDAVMTAKIYVWILKRMRGV